VTAPRPCAARSTWWTRSSKPAGAALTSSATRPGRDEPEQLWETTLDSNARTLLQVRVAHADDADDMFTRLMGDLVEPRREFIPGQRADAEVDI